MKNNFYLKEFIKIYNNKNVADICIINNQLFVKYCEVHEGKVYAGSPEKTTELSERSYKRLIRQLERILPKKKDCRFINVQENIFIRKYAR